MSCSSNVLCISKINFDSWEMKRFDNQPFALLQARPTCPIHPFGDFSDPLPQQAPL